MEKYSLLCRFCFSLCSSFGFVTQIKALDSRHQQSILGFFFYFMTILVLYIQVTEKFCWKCDSLDLRIEHRHFQSHKCIFERLPVLSEIWKKNYDTFTRLWRIVRTTHKLKILRALCCRVIKAFLREKISIDAKESRVTRSMS